MVEVLRCPARRAGATRSTAPQTSGRWSAGARGTLVVDTMGTVVGVRVQPASVPDREGAEDVRRTILAECPRLERVLADRGYRGEELADWVADFLPGVALDIVSVPKGQRGFVAQSFRWIVECTFAILGRHRRLAKDVEALAETGETLIHIAMAHLLLKQLAPAF